MEIKFHPKYNQRHKNTRVFVESCSEETVLEQLFNRKDRPHAEWRKTVIPEVLKELNLSADTKVRWSQYAGCTCPCSPAFIIQDTNGYDNVYVKLGKGE